MRSQRKNRNPDEWIQSSRKVCQRLNREFDVLAQNHLLLYYPAPGEFEIDLRFLKSTIKVTGQVNWLLPRVLPEDNCFEPYLIEETALNSPGKPTKKEVFEDQNRSLVPGAFGIPEPDPDRCKQMEVSEIDFVFVPGLAFDLEGCRVGYGGGYYDRFLMDLPNSIESVGVCYDFQLVDRVPRSQHDVPVDTVVSDEQMIEVKPQ